MKIVDIAYYVEHANGAETIGFSTAVLRGIILHSGTLTIVPQLHFIPPQWMDFWVNIAQIISGLT